MTNYIEEKQEYSHYGSVSQKRKGKKSHKTYTVEVVGPTKEVKDRTNKYIKTREVAQKCEEC